MNLLRPYSVPEPGADRVHEYDIRLNITIFSLYVVYFALRELAISLEVRYTRLVETDLNSHLSLYTKLIFVMGTIGYLWHTRY